MRSRCVCLFSSLGMALACLLLSVQGATASTVVNLTGIVEGLRSRTEFVFQTGAPHGYVPVIYTGLMVVPSGAIIRAEESVTVTGTFTPLGHLLATKVVIGSNITGPYHIATWAYDGRFGEGKYTRAASVRELVTVAQGDDKATTDCHAGTHHCQAAYYVDSNHNYARSPSACAYHPDAAVDAAASENWFVHQSGYSDSAHRVQGQSRDARHCRISELNPNSDGLQAWYRTYLRNLADNYDLYFIDDDAMLTVNEGYFPSGGGCPSSNPPYCYTTEEIPDDAAQMAAHVNFANAMTHRDGSPMRFVYQGASFHYATDVAPLVATQSFVGLTCEGCISSIQYPTRPTLFKQVLDEMATINQTRGMFLLISHGNSPAGSDTQIFQRLVTSGIIWLAYSEGHVIVQPDLENNTHNLAVWPEDMIYPSNPLQSMITNSNDLAVAPDVYRREFADCYLRGAHFGPCATVVNATASAVTVRSTWLSQTYHHVITLSGGDAVSGGVSDVVGASFVPNSTRVRSGGAILLAP